jgi:hypothetical protein
MSRASIKVSDNVLSAVKSFRECHPYKGTNDEKYRKFKALLFSMSHYYSVPVPSLYVTGMQEFSEIDSRLETTLGHYDDLRMQVESRKFSVLTILHEFRHHLQYHCRSMVMMSNDNEMDANAWSQLLFKSAWPERYNELVGKEEIQPVNENNLNVRKR